jgi:predicted DCC family thiol-disulfide oxidoreductase YuxK
VAAVVIFDGVCNLCSHTVQFIVAHERAPTISFASMQSSAGARLMRQFGLDPNDAKTFVLVEERAPYVRSEAAIRISRHLRMPWRLLGLVRFIPRRVRDYAYDTVARNRYRWFGRREYCMVPSSSIAGRFLSE